MKLLGLLLLALGASAQVPEAGRKTVASYVDINACWARPANAEADKLGLPARFCVTRLGVSNPNPGQLPFDDRARMLVEGTPVDAAVWISGGANYKDHWNISGNLWDGKERKPKCGTLSHAFAAIYMDITPQGEPLPVQKPEVRGFMIDGEIFCRTKAPSVDILYTREP